MCLTRSLRTLTAWAGVREVYSGVSGVSGSLVEAQEAAHQQCWVFFALELHGAEAKDGRKAVEEEQGIFT